jgi:hypothetical protein
MENPNSWSSGRGFFFIKKLKKFDKILTIKIGGVVLDRE